MFIDYRKVVQAPSLSQAPALATAAAAARPIAVQRSPSNIAELGTVTPEIHACHLYSSIVARRGTSIWTPSPGGPTTRLRSDFFPGGKPTMNANAAV